MSREHVQEKSIVGSSDKGHSRTLMGTDKAAFDDFRRGLDCKSPQLSCIMPKMATATLSVTTRTWYVCFFLLSSVCTQKSCAKLSFSESVGQIRRCA